MEYQERTQWLASIQVDDEVIMVGEGVHGRLSKHRVLKRTPSGQVVLDNQMRFGPDGRKLGGSGHWRATLEPLTAEFQEKVERQELLVTLRNLHWEKLPTAVLQAVGEALKRTLGDHPPGS